MNKERVLNLARALEEGPQDKSALRKFFERHLGRISHFNMNQVIHPCGTPACVWGHYVARTDLQSDFVADLRCSAQARLVTGPSAGWGLSYNDEKVCKHFGLRVNDVERLFAAPHDECTCDRAADYWYDDDDHEGDCLWHGGCGGATTPEDAAAYIRAFVAKREAEDALR